MLVPVTATGPEVEAGHRQRPLMGDLISDLGGGGGGGLSMGVAYKGMNKATASGSPCNTAQQ